MSERETTGYEPFEHCPSSEIRYSGEVSRGDKMAVRGTDPESYITEYTLAYENRWRVLDEDLGCHS